MRITGLLAAAALLLPLVLSGCSNDDNGTGPGDQNTNTTTWNEAGDYWVTRIDATSATDFAYYSFTTRDIVALTEAQSKTSMNWDLSFRRYTILTNDSLAGPADVQGADLGAIGFVDSADFVAVTAADVNGLPSNAWKPTAYKRVVSLFDPITRQPHRWVFAMKDAAGKYLKFQVPQIVGGGAPPMMGDVHIKYVYAATGTDLSGPVVEDTILSTRDTVYYDFSAGSYATNLPNANNRLDWDIRIFHYTVEMNSSVFGVGQTSAIQVFEIPGHDDPTDSTDFADYSVAETNPQSYFQDKLASVFENPTDWYEYTGPPTHQILSLKHVYAIRAGSKNYKLMIVTYNGTAGTPGNFILHWAEL